jgi:hypothetical protein
MDSLIGQSGPKTVSAASSLRILAKSALDKFSRTQRFFPPVAHLPMVVVVWRSAGGM